MVSRKHVFVVVFRQELVRIVGRGNSAATTAGIDVARMRTAPTAPAPFPMEHGNMHGKHVTDDSRGRSWDGREPSRARDCAWPGGYVGLGLCPEEVTKRTIATTQLDESVRIVGARR